VSEQTGFLQKHHLLLRRLHSLTGIVPIGVFLIMHLTTNSSIVWGALNGRAQGEGLERGIATFQHEVAWINNLPLLLLTEIALWGAIFFHSVLGFVYAFSGKANVGNYAYRDNWRYALQRISGYVGFVFIVYHIATLRWGWTFLVPGGTQWSHHFASSTLAEALRGSSDNITMAGILVSGLYFAGVTMLVFHFANGLWTAAITWGLTISDKAQKRWGYACAAIGVGLMGAGWSALAGFLLIDPAEARAIEERLIVEEYGEEKLEELIEKRRSGEEVLEEAAANAAP